MDLEMVKIACDTFLTIVKYCAPISIIWSFGYLAYTMAINAITGKEVKLK